MHDTPARVSRGRGRKPGLDRPFRTVARGGAVSRGGGAWPHPVRTAGHVAAGRLSLGRVRLDLRHGCGVAQEIRDGKVRVELAINPGASFRGRLEHGMPGTIEVAVEHVTPLALVLRTTGQWMTRRP